MTKRMFSKCSTIFFPYLLIFGVLEYGCKKPDEPPPFFDGLELAYTEEFRKGLKEEDHLWTREIRYEFQKNQDGTFKVLQEVQTERGQGLNDQIDPMPYPKVGDNLTTDSQGKVLQGGDGMNFLNGSPSYIWLPSKYRAKGKEVIPIVRRVEEKISWEKWEVWPVVFGDSSINSHYYDIETGILVGTESANGKLKMMLTKTNLEGLKVSNPNPLVMEFRNN